MAGEPGVLEHFAQGRSRRDVQAALPDELAAELNELGRPMVAIGGVTIIPGRTRWLGRRRYRPRRAEEGR